MSSKAKKSLITAIALSSALMGMYTFLSNNVLQSEKRAVIIDSIGHDDPISHDCNFEYVRDEVCQEYVSALEKGILTDATDSSATSALILFSNDSNRVELFFSDRMTTEIATRRYLCNGDSEWVTSGQNAKKIFQRNGIWVVSTIQKDIYRQPKEEYNSSLGNLQARTFQGSIPDTSGVDVHYLLAVRNREYSGDGIFMLIKTYPAINNGNARSYRYTGKRYTLRGTADNNDATVWQLKTSSGTTFNFLYNNSENTLTLLNDNFEEIDTSVDNTLRPSITSAANR